MGIGGSSVEGDALWALSAWRRYVWGFDDQMWMLGSLAGGGRLRLVGRVGGNVLGWYAIHSVLTPAS